MSAVSEFEYRYNMTIKAFPSHAEPVFESASQQDLVWARGGAATATSAACARCWCIAPVMK